jgi:uncharacterized protein
VTEGVRDAAVPPRDARIYVDSSAFVKLYVPEPESQRVDAFLRGRTGLAISGLVITEVLAAVARRKREGVLRSGVASEIREAVLADAASGSFNVLDLDPDVHREAERLLFAVETVPLRTLDALHVALALSASATHVVTFDLRMREAAALVGLHAEPL